MNVSRTHPLREFALLVAETALLIAGLYLLLGLATDFAASRVPVEVENRIGKRALDSFAGEADPALEKRLHQLLATVPADSPLHRYRFSVRVMTNDEVNAVALPGGHIVVFSGLLKKVRSENELAMVLGHELGHFAHRDHLRGLGRGLGLAVAAQLFFGSGNAGSDVTMKMLLPLTASYSRKQEAAADAFGLEILSARYGHAGGAAEFFERLSRQETSLPGYLLASHPNPRDRIAAIRDRIAERGLHVGATEPLNLAAVAVSGRDDR